MLRSLNGMAAGRAVVVFEAEHTACWPALDPQTWQPRSIPAGPGATDPPIAISIDPRDEEHSLMRAFVRLAGDPALRTSLGAAARSWWERTATVEHAVAAWRAVVAEAVTLEPPPRPAQWPAHLDATGDATMRAILDQFGLSQS